MNLTDLVLSQKKEEEKYFKNYSSYAKKIAIITRKSLPDLKIYLFGSILKNKQTPSSDIDLLIFSEKMPQRLSARNRIKVKILKEIGFFSPFELHLVNREEFEFYQKFIDKMKEV